MKVSARSLVVGLLLTSLLGARVSHAQAEVAIRRFALIAGANSGGAQRTPLRYAVSDANTFARVLEELGGVSTQDRVVLLDPDRAQFEAGVEEIRSLLVAHRASATRTELILYYSGHSDEQGLLLSGDRLPYDRLREALATLPADVRIAILDSCQSGALTRQKGGVMRAPFLLDESAEVRGHAILTSSAEDEAAQESDRLGASFFTHYLVSGLRGAADTTSDGRVTLNEAYNFAYNETLSRTQRTQSGPQHAAYDIQLTGTGDLVMTDLRGTSAGVLLADAVAGRLFVRDEHDRLVVELTKAPGRVVELGLEPGLYKVTLQQTSLFEGELEVPAGGRATLSLAELHPVSPEATVVRGDDTVTKELVERAVVAQVAPGMPSYAGPGQRVRARLVLGFALSEVDELAGFGLSAGAHLVHDEVAGLQLAALANFAGRVSTGVQLAGLFNLSRGPTEGAQVAGLFNHSASEVRGAQLAGVYNFAGNVTGAQVGVVNIVGDVHGAQVGVVNIARHVTGSQVGVLNIADDVDGVPVGLVSVLREGRLQLDSWASTAEPANFAVRFSGRHIDTLIVAGAFDVGHTDLRAGELYVGLGLGGHLQLGPRLTLELDAMAADPYVKVRDDQGQLYTRLRATVALSLLGDVGVFAGLSYHGFFGFEGADNREIGRGLVDWTRVTRHGALTIRQWPGLHVGVRL